MSRMMSSFVLASFLMPTGFAFADQSTGEKVEAKAKDAKRAVKKKAHRVGEELCQKGDAQCLADKAKNRGTEGADYVKDKADEAKDKID